MYFGCSYQNLEIEEKMEKKQKLDKKKFMLKCQNYFYHNFLAKYWFSIIFSPIGVTFFSLSISI
jgi:hypothetical protein